MEALGIEPRSAKEPHLASTCLSCLLNFTRQIPTGGSSLAIPVLISLLYQPSKVNQPARFYYASSRTTGMIPERRHSIIYAASALIGSALIVRNQFYELISSTCSLSCLVYRRSQYAPLSKIYFLPIFIAFSISRFASFLFMSSRLSCFFLPFANPISSFALPLVKYIFVGIKV